MMSRESPLMARAFWGDNPQGRMIAWICSTGARAMACDVAANAQSCGVTKFTRLSVHWAESTTATSKV